MRPLALSLALMATLFSVTATAQELATDKPVQMDQSQWWQGLDYAKPQDNPTAMDRATTSQDKTAPDWLAAPGFGWQSTTATPSLANNSTTYHVGDLSWGVQARQAARSLAQVEWEDSITAGELRLVERLAKAKAAGEPYLVWVNLPAYRLRVLDTRDGGILMESRVIVGKSGRHTPRMDTRIVNLKFNPDWSPPKSAAGKSYTPPGPRNPLGRVRFSTDNGIGIYLHDTNNHDLFNTPVRAYSLGCVRVEAWHELAVLLSGQDDAWIGRQTSDWRTRWVDVPDVPVFIDYQRVDFNDEGALVEHPDIYRLGNRSK